MNGCWKELAAFIRNLFHSTFKTNPYLERALMTGITRVSKELIFSDLNNLEAVTTTAEKYEESFGFTEEEVFAALDEFGLSDNKKDVKNGMTDFGSEDVRIFTIHGLSLINLEPPACRRISESVWLPEVYR